MSTSTPSSQGATVLWGLVPIGRLTSFRPRAGSAVLEEITHVEAPVVGEGANSRVVKQYDCVAIDPGGVDIGLYGAPPFIVEQIGENATITVTFSDGSFSLDAYLEDFDVSGNVGEFLQGTAKFRFSGAGWGE